MVAIKKNSKSNSNEINEEGDKIKHSIMESSSKTSLRRSLRSNKIDEANGNVKDLKKKNIKAKTDTIATVSKPKKSKAKKDKEMVQIDHEDDIDDKNSIKGHNEISNEQSNGKNGDDHNSDNLLTKGLKAKTTKKLPTKGKKMNDDISQEDTNEVMDHVKEQLESNNIESLAENGAELTTDPNNDQESKDDEISSKKDSNNQATTSRAKKTKSVKKEPAQKKKAKLAVESKEVVQDDHNTLDEKLNGDQTNGKEADLEGENDNIPQTNGVSDEIKEKKSSADIPSESKEIGKKGILPKGKRAKKEANGITEPAKEDPKSTEKTIAPNDNGTESETVKANGKKKGKKTTPSKTTKADEENMELGDGDKQEEVKSAEEPQEGPKDNHYEIYKGKNWKKSQNAPKISAMKMGAAFHKKWSKRMEEKEALAKVKETQKSIQEGKTAAKVANAKRKEANALRKQQNERKSEVVQVIKDPTKIKKMKKKHLRALEKRDVSY